MIDRREREVSEMYQPAGSQAMGNVRGVLGNLSNFGQTALPLQRHSMTSMLGHRVCTGGRLSDSPASGFVDPASTFPAGLSQHLREQMLLYREESAELRAAAQYYREESQRSAEESSQESERTRRYRDLAQQALAQAEEADRRAEEYQGQLL